MQDMLAVVTCRASLVAYADGDSVDAVGDSIFPSDGVSNTTRAVGIRALHVHQCIEALLDCRNAIAVTGVACGADGGRRGVADAGLRNPAVSFATAAAAISETTIHIVASRYSRTTGLEVDMFFKIGAARAAIIQQRKCAEIPREVKRGRVLRIGVEDNRHRTGDVVRVDHLCGF